MALSDTDAGSPVPAFKRNFLNSCLSANVLTFGTYTLKSGRKSPYFFNAGSFHSGNLLSAIGTAYAHTIINFLSINSELPRPDTIFGPAYKGIPLACCTLLELQRIDPVRWGNVEYSFNRKEKKDHGEGGGLVGGSLQGANVLVVDDVITAGTAMRETIEIVKREGGKVVGFVVAVDRMEKMPSTTDDDGVPRPSAMGQIRKEYGVPTASIVTLDDLIELLRMKGDEPDMERLKDYRRRYIASD
ncbi:orotate phosphoribosyltransferase [Xanthoria calcicola]